MTVEKSTIGAEAWYTWDTTPSGAVAKVASFTGIPKSELVGKHTGLTRPGGYEYEGNEVDGYQEVEALTETKRRYVVRMVR